MWMQAVSQSLEWMNKNEPNAATENSKNKHTSEAKEKCKFTMILYIFAIFIRIIKEFIASF